MILRNQKIWTAKELAQKDIHVLGGERKKRLYYKPINQIRKLELYKSGLFFDNLMGRDLFVCSRERKETEFYLGFVPVHLNVLKMAGHTSIHTILHPLDALQSNPFKEQLEKDYVKLERLGQHLSIPRDFYLN